MSLGYERRSSSRHTISVLFYFLLSFFVSLFFFVLRSLAFFGTLRIYNIRSVRQTHTTVHIEIYIYMARKYICLYINMVYVVKCIVGMCYLINTGNSLSSPRT